MTREEWREYERHLAESDLALLDRIEHHRRILIAEGRKPITSDAWVAFHRRRAEKTLAAHRRG